MLEFMPFCKKLEIEVPKGVKYKDFEKMAQKIMLAMNVKQLQKLAQNEDAPVFVLQTLGFICKINQVREIGYY